MVLLVHGYLHGSRMRFLEDDNLIQLIYSYVKNKIDNGEKLLEDGYLKIRFEGYLKILEEYLEQNNNKEYAELVETLKIIKKSRMGSTRKNYVKVAESIARGLKSSGFTVGIHTSRISQSVYLRIDGGCLKSLRVSNHFGNSYYNVMFGMGDKVCYYKGEEKRVIGFKNFNKKTIEEVVRKVVSIYKDDRRARISKIGASAYDRSRMSGTSWNYDKGYITY